ncbi:hypothetical protein C4K68_02145 [Pokkaliibacter plantistimulans]|uniref:Uncharacterized protein n=1 Tax=Proteobacteria bacterium 228 TaxID=2083153 RepID=A0A2S5KVU8_9PROT|nr:hypothetical protein [Pokkaliibacter plantistimulans]PPC78981.1 hypothetical protein C4K68_02145 [Pokkaliibacter plantistimulans]
MALNAADAQKWVDSLGPRPDPVQVAKAAMAIEKKLVRQDVSWQENEFEEAQAALQVLTASLYETEWSEQEQAQIAALSATAPAPVKTSPAADAAQPQFSANFHQQQEVTPAPTTAEEKLARFAALKDQLQKR